MNLTYDFDLGIKEKIVTTPSRGNTLMKYERSVTHYSKVMSNVNVVWGQAERHTNGQIDKQTFKQMDKRKNGQTDKTKTLPPNLTMRGCKKIPF